MKISCMTPTLFVREYADADIRTLALQRTRFSELSDEEWLFCLRQIHGRQLVRRKLPEIAATEGWLYPAHINIEQCSSELTAKYKRGLLQNTGVHTLVDLTGGFGVDCLYMGQVVRETHYVERNGELCRLMEHNARLLNSHITVHHTDAESFLQDKEFLSGHPAEKVLVYADPSRRSESGGKVFLIQDCDPDISRLMPIIRQCAERLMLKLSPMLDITAAWCSLGCTGATYVVAVAGEVKEVLLCMPGEPVITAIDLKYGISVCFTREEEHNAVCGFAERVMNYLYEPNAALLKAGADKLIGEKWNVMKTDANSRFYTSDEYLANFPGRVFRVTGDKPSRGVKYNIISRNYPLTPDEIRRKWHIKEGDGSYVIGLRLNGNPQILVCERLL